MPEKTCRESARGSRRQCRGAKKSSDNRSGGAAEQAVQAGKQACKVASSENYIAAIAADKQQAEMQALQAGTDAAATATRPQTYQN